MTPVPPFRDLADLNAQARAWVMDEAGVRCHGTTRRSPLALFALEAPLLQALPGQAPDLGTWHRVSLHRDCHVQFEQVLYSAPFTLVGKLLWLRATDAAVALFEDYRHVATHARGRRAGQRVSVREHLPPEAQAFFGRDRAWCATQAERVGSSCVALIERKRSANPSSRPMLNPAISQSLQRRRWRSGHRSTTVGAVPGAGGGVSGVGVEGHGLGGGQRG